MPRLRASVDHKGLGREALEHGQQQNRGLEHERASGVMNASPTAIMSSAS